MCSQPPSQRRAAAAWRVLALALLLPTSGALAQTNSPTPARPPASATPEADPREPASKPATMEQAEPAAAADTSSPPAPQTPAVQPAPPSSEAGSVPPQKVRAMAPTRAPGAAQPTGQARRRRPMPAAEPSAEERQEPLPRQRTTSPAQEGAQQDEDFGRWERRAQPCEMQLAEPQGRAPLLVACHSVRIDQQLAGLLSIRFLPEAADTGTATEQLLFAGVLLPGSQPMRCRDSRCEPSWPIRLQVSALATSPTGTLGLPLARVVQGNCSVEKSRVLCQARDREGRRWQAKGRW